MTSSGFLGERILGLLARRDKILAKVSKLAVEYKGESERLEEDFKKKIADLVQDLLQEEYLD